MVVYVDMQPLNQALVCTYEGSTYKTQSIINSRKKIFHQKHTNCILFASYLSKNESHNEPTS